MAEQRPYRVDVHFCTDQFAGRGVSQHVRRDFLAGQRRNSVCTTLNESIDPEPGVRLSVSTEEHGLARLATVYELAQCALRVRQQRALAYLPAFPVQRHKCMATIPTPDLNITHFQARRFGDACPDVPKKVQKSVFYPASLSRTVRNIEHGICLNLAQCHDRLRRRFLERNAADSTGPSDMCGITAADKPGKSSNGRQPLVSGLHRTASTILKVTEEVQNEFGADVVDPQLVVIFAEFPAEERDKQLEG